MVTDNQVRRLFRLMESAKSFGVTACRAGMDEKTARKYRRLGKLPSEVRREYDWRTREDPFAALGRGARGPNGSPGGAHPASSEGTVTNRGSVFRGSAASRVVRSEPVPAPDCVAPAA
jgi:hypothetical protein